MVFQGDLYFKYIYLEKKQGKVPEICCYRYVQQNNSSFFSSNTVFFTQCWIFLENRLQNDIEKARCSCVSNPFIVHNHTVAQHHCFHNYVARISEIFPSVGQINFLKLLEKVNISFTYLN